MNTKKSKFSRFETKVKLSIMLMLLLMVLSNFMASYLFQYTRDLLISYNSNKQRQTALIFKNYLLNASDKQKALYFINNHLSDEDMTSAEVINRDDFESANIKPGKLNKSYIRSCFRNREFYIYQPTKELQLSYIPLELSTDGEVNSILVVKNRIKWFNHLMKVANWNDWLRLASVISVLIFGILIIRMITKPYRNVRSLAGVVFDKEISDDDDPEYIEKVFDYILNEVKKKESELRDMVIKNDHRDLGLTGSYEYVFGGISSGLILCDRDGLIIRFNPAASEVLDTDSDSSIGKHYTEALEHLPDIKFLIGNALKHGKTYSRVEIRLFGASGNEKLIGATSSIIKNSRNEVMGMAILLIDLTRIKRMEEESSYRDKMAALGEMSAGMAHEIRNSAAAIVGFGRLISKFAQEPERVQNLSNDIIRESEEMEAFMKKFLSFARPLEIDINEINLNSLLDECIEKSQMSFPQVDIRKRILDRNLTVHADYNLIKQCILNLIYNACDAVDGKGDIVVKVSPYISNLSHIIESHSDRCVKIMVADNGVGIDAEAKEKIFYPFFTRKDKGSGLGLAIVKKIIAHHNGIVRVHSREDRGTIFTIILPIGFPAKQEVVTTQSYAH
ncbi:MAG: PAS domain-containing protein [candidate division Zixibacteria bacterium]|nr:PAS domain-containing protein [candidate division Zixibacteria bacterium]